MRQRVCLNRNWRITAGARKINLGQAAASDGGQGSAACVHRIRQKEPKKPWKRYRRSRTEKTAGALEEIGNNNDVSLGHRRGGRFDSMPPIRPFVGSSQICCSHKSLRFPARGICGPGRIDHTRDGVGTVHGRGAILEMST